MDVHISRLRDTAADRELARIRPNVLAHVLQHAAERGIASAGWFAGLGLAPEQLLDPHLRLSWRQVHTLLTRALAALDEPCAGLTVGSGESVGVFGLLGLLMSSAATFGEAVRLGVRNHEVSGSLLDMDFEDAGADEAALVFWSRFDDPALLPFLCEEILASTLMLARALLGPRFRLRRVDLTYAPPRGAELYACALGTEVRFGAAANRMVLDRRWLSLPLASGNPLAARQALELCEAQRRAESVAPQREVVATVERLLRLRLPARCGIEDAARSLNLSARSLRRHLVRAGRPFRDLQDGVRARYALELLRGGPRPIGEVAAALGFSDTREFRRAFKRWTGMPPRAARDGAAAQVGRFAPLDGAQTPSCRARQCSTVAPHAAMALAAP